jgi:hypothetical protein
MSVTPYAAFSLLLKKNGAPEEVRTPIRRFKFHISNIVLEMDSLTLDPV